MKCCPANFDRRDWNPDHFRMNLSSGELNFHGNARIQFAFCAGHIFQRNKIFLRAVLNLSLHQVTSVLRVESDAVKLVRS